MEERLLHVFGVVIRVALRKEERWVYWCDQEGRLFSERTLLPKEVQ